MWLLRCKVDSHQCPVIFYHIQIKHFISEKNGYINSTGPCHKNSENHGNHINHSKEDKSQRPLTSMLAYQFPIQYTSIQVLIICFPNNPMHEIMTTWTHTS